MIRICNAAKLQCNHSYNEAEPCKKILPKINKSKIELPIIQHQVIEIFLVENISYEDSQILELGTEFCKGLDLTILDALSHNFEPYGVSILFVLSESHCAIHYWPENYYLHVDLVTCHKKKIDLGELENKIKKIFFVDRLNIYNIKY